MKYKKKEPEKAMDHPGENPCRIHEKILPPDTIQLFLPLYLKHPAALRLRSAGINMCGISQTTPGFRIGRTPDFLFALFTTSGTGRFETPGYGFDLTAGTLLLAPAGVFQHYCQTGDEPWRFLWFHFKERAPGIPFEFERPAVGRSCDAAYLEHAMNGFSVEIVGALEQLSREEREPPWIFYQDSLSLRDSLRMFRLAPDDFNCRADELAELHASVMLCYLEREFRALSNRRGDAEPEEDDRLERLWEKVRLDLGRGWQLPEMAAMSGMSVPTLIRRIRKRYDATPMQLLQKLRLKFAARLLLSEGLGVSEIAAKIGYDTVTAFSAAFRREFGASPRAWRQAHFRASGREDGPEAAAGPRGFTFMRKNP